ncbi:hypothetical protein ACFYYH_29860 [Streptomyces sp. NPDC002018]|uniref:hypothetical protein n=1 Tax=Streptomyces sp. NPDC002018 TaxID=3364629 RepID=UPI0036BBAEDD
MKPVQGWAAFDIRTGRAAQTLLRHQGYDGGWGLTLTSVSSIVNTSEVLAVLGTAGTGGKPVRDALDFLTSAIREHCRPRHKGGRGENTRFVAFGLTGLLHHPQFFHRPGVAEAAAWCVTWLEDHQVEHGWPEVARVDDASLHQTALAVQALTRLQSTLNALGPDLPLAGSVNTSTLAERVAPLVSHGVRGLLYHRRSSGAWGWRTYVDTSPSPSKTALCLLALSSVLTLTGPDGLPTGQDEWWDVGGAGGTVRKKQLGLVVAEAGQWLLRNHHRWEEFVEDDKDVQGTAWEHMAYALGVQAAVRAGASPRDPRLSKAWRLMDTLWDPESGLWTEPGASGRRPTVRAAFSTIMAYGEARAHITRSAIGGQDTHVEGTASSEVLVRKASLGSERRVLLTAEGSGTVVTCTLSERLFALVRLLVQEPDYSMTVAEIARALYVAPSSVPKYVQRLNRAVSEAFDGAPTRLIAARTVNECSGYGLTSRQASQAARSASTG